MEKVSMELIEKIYVLSHEKKQTLRKLNNQIEKTYQGNELKYVELIYQIINQMDAPTK
jgi:hypothetical protein